MLFVAMFGCNRKSPLSTVSNLPRCYAISPLSNSMEVTTGKGKKKIDPCSSAWLPFAEHALFPGAGQAGEPSWLVNSCVLYVGS